MSGSPYYAEWRAGLSDTQQALRNADKTVRKELRKRFRPAGEIVAVEVRKNIREKGLVRSRRLLKSVRVVANLSAVRVAANAKSPAPKRVKAMRMYPPVKFPNGGYRYGRRLEFNPLFGGRYEFFYPAWKAKKEDAVSEFRKILDEVEREFAGQTSTIRTARAVKRLRR